MFPGENGFSRALALDRANAACSYLKGQGVEGAFQTITLGKRHPRAPNRTARGAPTTATSR